MIFLKEQFFESFKEKNGCEMQAGCGSGCCFTNNSVWPCTQVGVAGRPPNNVQVSDMTLTGRTCRCGYVGNALRFGLEIMRSEKAGMIRHDGGFSDLKMTKYLDSLKMDSLK